MTDIEILEIVHDKISNLSQEIHQLLFEMKKELNVQHDFYKSSQQQMAMIETMIHQHAIGVQNVYNRFTEFKDNKDEELEKLKEEIRELQKNVFIRTDEHGKDKLFDLHTAKELTRDLTWFNKDDKISND